MFIDVFENACSNKGISPSRLLLDIGIGKSTLTHWRRGGDPSNKTKKMIADYFGVSVEDFMAGKLGKEKVPSAQTDDKREDLYKEIILAVGKLSPERQRIVLAQIEAILAIPE